MHALRLNTLIVCRGQTGTHENNYQPVCLYGTIHAYAQPVHQKQDGRRPNSRKQQPLLTLQQTVQTPISLAVRLLALQQLRNCVTVFTICMKNLLEIFKISTSYHFFPFHFIIVFDPTNKSATLVLEAKSGMTPKLPLATHLTSASFFDIFSCWDQSNCT